MSDEMTPRELAHAGVLGAAALLLPTIFHLFHLGHVLLPMYLPLMVLPYLVSPRVAGLTACMTPLLSALLTSMPPFYPPVAPCMALELGLMALLASWLHGRVPRLGVFASLLPVLLLGRLFYFISFWGLVRLMALPATLLASLSVSSGWPGILLMLMVVPAVLRLWPRVGAR